MAPFEKTQFDLERGNSISKSETLASVTQVAASESDMAITPTSTRTPTRVPARINTDITVVESEGEGISGHGLGLA